MSDMDLSADSTPLEPPAAGVEPGAATDPGEPSAAAPDGGQPSGADAAPGWTPELLEQAQRSPEYQQAVLEAAQELARSFQPEPGYGHREQPQDDGGFQLPELDPWSETFAQDLAQRDQALMQMMLGGVQQMLAPVLGDHQTRIEDAGRAEAFEQFKAANVNVEGLEDFAWGAVREAYGSLASRFGDGERTANLAVQQVAQQLAARDERLRTSAVEAYKESLRRAAGQPQDGAVTGSAMESAKPAGNYDEVIRRWENGQRHRVESYTT